MAIRYIDLTHCRGELFRSGFFLDKNIFSCNTYFMASKKTPKRKISSRKASVPQNTLGLSYDTKLIIVLLLLVFVYPLGIIFMWVWMKNWPVWLKILIMLPLLLGLFMAMIFVIMIRALIHEARIERMQELQRLQNEKQMQQQQRSQFTLTPGPSVSLSPTYSSGTY